MGLGKWESLRRKSQSCAITVDALSGYTTDVTDFTLSMNRLAGSSSGGGASEIYSHTDSYAKLSPMSSLCSEDLFCHNSYAAQQLQKHQRGSAASSRFRCRGASVKTNCQWREIMKLGLLDDYLEIQDIFAIRQTCILAAKKTKFCPFNGKLSFHAFRGVDDRKLCEKIVPAACCLVKPCVRREGLGLDFTDCTLLEDVSLAYITLSLSRASTNLRSLNLDFCFQITDKGLRALLNTELPSLESLSLRCARSNELVGQPLLSDLSEKRWPRFIEFSCSFTNIMLEPLEVMAAFVTKNASQIENASRNAVPQVDIVGSWASRLLMEERLGLSQTTQRFRHIMRENNIGQLENGSEVVKDLVLLAATEVLKLSKLDKFKNYHLLQLIANQGSELLVNAPMACPADMSGMLGAKRRGANVSCPVGQFDSCNGAVMGTTGGTPSSPPSECEEIKTGPMKVWTSPLSLAIQARDQEMVEGMLVAGAQVDAWDPLGKTPLFHACDLQLTEVASILIGNGASSSPHDLGGYSTINAAVESGNERVVNLLLDNGLSVNNLCQTQSLKHYKSPLFVACVNSTKSPAVVLSLLQRGADPNWALLNTRTTPTLVVYHNSPELLPDFLKAGAGATESTRWVLSEVLSAAINKGDCQTVYLLVETYPDLIGRCHPLWSAPHVQAACSGQVQILRYLLEESRKYGSYEMESSGRRVSLDSHPSAKSSASSFGVGVNSFHNGVTALHGAASEGVLESVKVLVEYGADVNLVASVGQSPLQLACERNRMTVAEELLGNPLTDINLCDEAAGETALITCIRLHNTPMARKIMEKGRSLDIDAADSLGNSALTHALGNGEYELAETLMDRGAKGVVGPDSEASLFASLKATTNKDSRIAGRAIKTYKEAKRCNKAHSKANAAAAAAGARRRSSSSGASLQGSRGNRGTTTHDGATTITQGRGGEPRGIRGIISLPSLLSKSSLPHHTGDPRQQSSYRTATATGGGSMGTGTGTNPGSSSAMASTGGTNEKRKLTVTIADNEMGDGASKETCIQRAPQQANISSTQATLTSTSGNERGSGRVSDNMRASDRPQGAPISAPPQHPRDSHRSHSMAASLILYPISILQKAARPKSAGSTVRN
eukprot:GHVN01000543.1.p1 GENE.GHVN01000543.1~~GHVN01000543.1.p1  ORF type:complete len:1121 (+),score=133.92 GHVN01000543.1:7336-10698(+)